ncbi:MAG: shikimate dehydrogenase [Hadesarchaea archaeon]|nr:shikimate dehydrogenase [Hadesarchaea archaeon]
MISEKTKLVALIGDPVEHSLSPAIHNAAFKKVGLNYTYIAFRVTWDTLPGIVKRSRMPGIAGLNITIPYKVAVLDMVDRLDEFAKRAGAVNTIKNDEGKLIGFNTDGMGAIEALRDEGIELKERKVLLLGAGGAARAIAFSLAGAGAELTISNRTLKKAKELAAAVERDTGAKVQVVKLGRKELKEALADRDILINATPVGMYPNVDQALVTADMMHPGLIVNDIVYKPLKTKLLQEAEKAGARTVTGLGMLIHQAAASFEIWTGRKAPIKTMRAAAERELRRER